MSSSLKQSPTDLGCKVLKSHRRSERRSHSSKVRPQSIRLHSHHQSYEPDDSFHTIILIDRPSCSMFKSKVQMAESADRVPSLFAPVWAEQTVFFLRPKFSCILHFHQLCLSLVQFGTCSIYPRTPHYSPCNSLEESRSFHGFFAQAYVELVELKFVRVQ